MAGRAVDAAGALEGWEIFIKYLPAEATGEKLRDFFATAGPMVGQPRLMMHPQTGKCKGIGWITFASNTGMAEALRWDGCAFGGRHLSITAAKQQHAGIRPSLQAPGTHTPAPYRSAHHLQRGFDVPAKLLCRVARGQTVLPRLLQHDFAASA